MRAKEWLKAQRRASTSATSGADDPGLNEVGDLLCTYIVHGAVLESYSKLPVNRPSLSLWANKKAAHERGTDEPLRKSCQNGFSTPNVWVETDNCCAIFFFTFELKDRLADSLGYQLSLRGTWASIDPIRVVFASATNDVGPDRGGAGGNFQESKLIRIA